MQRNLPSGTVTFLFTDVEGSTKLLHERGAEGFAQALAEHRRILRDAFAANGGVEVDTQGDAFFVAFPTAPGALRAAAAALEGLASGPIRVRMGIHTGTPLLTDEGYVGVDVHRAARIAACGHGGQVLVSAATAALSSTEELRDLGEHRLKDLSAPERIYQLGHTEFPRLKTLYQSNLPIPSTLFLGRRSELADVLALMAQEGVRLVTLTGPGGTGKTRLAAQAAAELSPRYPDGVWWIALAAVSEPALVLEAAKLVLGAKDGLAQRIAGGSMLLLFDNFEQVLAAAGDVAGLLASCPNVDLLVTSREPLHISGEQEYAVPPLLRAESMALFVTRAHAVKPDFAADDAVSEICRRLDDLPLAIELAAARVKALAPKQILDRLEKRLPVLVKGARDLPDRQRTLTATIAWSYDLLSETERRLFDRLSVFVGGCTHDAAQTVCDADLDRIAALVDKSLLRLEGDRYVMLETIREFAIERLKDSARQDEFRGRHAVYYLGFAVAAKGERDIMKRIQRLADEEGNLRTSLVWFVDRDDVEAAISLVVGVYGLWYIRGQLREGLAWTEAVMGLPGAQDSTQYGDLLAVAGEFPRFLGNFARARVLKEQAIAIYRQTGPPTDLASLLHDLGDIVASEGDLERARSLHQEALGIRREIGEPRGISHALNGLTVLALREGDYAQALTLAEEEVALCRLTPNRPDELSDSLHCLGEALRKLGQMQKAATTYLESLLASLTIKDLRGIAESLDGLADVAATIGSSKDAATLWAAAQRIFDETGAQPWNADETREGLAAARSALGSETFESAWREGKALSTEQSVAHATAFVELFVRTDSKEASRPIGSGL